MEITNSFRYRDDLLENEGLKFESGYGTKSARNVNCGFKTLCIMTGIMVVNNNICELNGIR